MNNTKIIKVLCKILYPVLGVLVSAFLIFVGSQIYANILSKSQIEKTYLSKAQATETYTRLINSEQREKRLVRIESKLDDLICLYLTQKFCPKHDKK